MKINKITPCGNMVLLKLVEQKKAEDFKKLKSGLIIPNAIGTDAASVATAQGGEKKKVVAYVEAIGPLVPADVVFKIGDEVMYNSYDLMTLGDEDNFYGLTKADSILAVIEATR